MTDLLTIVREAFEIQDGSYTTDELAQNLTDRLREEGFRLVPESVALVLDERNRQPGLGYTAEHDHEHAPELLDASAGYAHYVAAGDRDGLQLTLEEVECWPEGWPYNPRTLRRTTVKSIALGLAALDDLLARGVE